MALPRSPPSPRRWSPRGAPTSPTRETRIRAGGACVERELASFSACGENRRSADSSGAIEDCSAPAREPPAGSELGHGAGSSRRRRRSAARSDVGWRCAGGIRPTLVARRPPLARLHESGIPAVEIIVGAVRIGRLTPAQPLQRWNHLPMPPCYVGEDLAHPPAPQPYLAHLGLVEVLDGRLEFLVLLLGVL